MTTRTAGATSISSRAISMPDMPGMFRSMSTTSARAPATRSTPLRRSWPRSPELVHDIFRNPARRRCDRRRGARAAQQDLQQPTTMAAASAAASAPGPCSPAPTPPAPRTPPPRTSPAAPPWKAAAVRESATWTAPSLAAQRAQLAPRSTPGPARPACSPRAVQHPSGWPALQARPVQSTGPARSPRRSALRLGVDDDDAADVRVADGRDAGYWAVRPRPWPGGTAAATAWWRSPRAARSRSVPCTSPRRVAARAVADPVGGLDQPAVRSPRSRRPSGSRAAASRAPRAGDPPGRQSESTLPSRKSRNSGVRLSCQPWRRPSANASRNSCAGLRRRRGSAPGRAPSRRRRPARPSWRRPPGRR